MCMIMIYFQFISVFLVEFQVRNGVEILWPLMLFLILVLVRHRRPAEPRKSGNYIQLQYNNDEQVKFSKIVMLIMLCI